MYKKNLLLLLLFFIRFSIFAQDTSIRTTTMPFLLINSDARAGAMGDVGVASSSDSYALYHNPAKINFRKKQTGISLNYTPWLRNLTKDIFFGGISYNNRFEENKAFGVDIKYFSLGNIETNNGTTSTGNEHPSEFAITGVYGLKLSHNFSMAIGLKYINSNYKINSANTNIKSVNTFAVDVSGYYQSNEENFKSFNGIYRLGFNIANIGPKISYTPNNENFIPTNAKLGAGYDFIFDGNNILGINTEFSKLLIPSNALSDKGWFEGMFSSLADTDFTNELKEITWGLGAEYTYNKSFALRSGYFHESRTKGNRQYFTLGAGFTAKLFEIDISYLINNSDFDSPLKNTVRFSLSYDIGEIY